MAHTSDEDILLSLIPANGDPMGNVSLLRELSSKGWDREKYWRIRDGLLDQGVLTTGKGKGGSVRRVVESIEPIASNAQKGPRPANETALYNPLLKVLSEDWARSMRMKPDQIHFEVTAKQGKKDTGGTWTRPDITAVSVRTFPHLPGKYLDIWTFEVKTAECLDVTAIFEAAAHASRATRSYAVLQVRDEGSSRTKQIIERCEREANRLRVGLITFTQASSFDTWEPRVDAPRIEADPELLEDFITQLSEEAKERLSRWK